jgi:hypothetical protein
VWLGQTEDKRAANSIRSIRLTPTLPLYTVKEVGGSFCCCRGAPIAYLILVLWHPLSRGVPAFRKQLIRECTHLQGGLYKVLPFKTASELVTIKAVQSSYSCTKQGAYKIRKASY